MSITSMLVHRQVPVFPAGLPTYINRPDAYKRPIPYGNAGMHYQRSEAGEASIRASRHAILDAIKAGATNKLEIQAKCRLSKSSVFNHCKSLVKDGVLILNKKTSPHTLMLR